MKPPDEQAKEFWERCGLTFRDEVGYHGWYRGIGVTGQERVAMTLPIDLNSLFRYAVPGLNQKYNEVQWLLVHTKDHGWECSIYAEEWIGEAKDNDPALALFWAISKAGLRP